MKTTKPNWNMKKLQRMANNGELRFDYPIQRASGQWDELQKSLLIHSVVAGMPIPPIAVAKADVDGVEGEYVIDGKQRTTTILDFLAGIKDENGNYPQSAYRLHDDTPNVIIEDVEYAISSLYFDEIHDDVKSELHSEGFMIQRMENASDEEIEEIFNRWNNGTPLTKQQKARGKMGTANATIIANILSHPFIQAVAQFTPLQRKRSDDEAVILQTMMLTSDIELESFVSDKILAFASSLRDKDISALTNPVKDALDYVMESEVSSPLFKKLHLPTLLVVAEKAKADGVNPKVFSAWVEDFNNAINIRTRSKAMVESNYKMYTGAGSVKRDKVLGRKDAMLAHFAKFVEVYELPQEEVQAPQQTEEKEVEAPKAPKASTKSKNKNTKQVKAPKQEELSFDVPEAPQATAEQEKKTEEQEQAEAQAELDKALSQA